MIEHRDHIAQNIPYTRDQADRARRRGIFDPVVVVMYLDDDDARRLVDPPGRDPQVRTIIATTARLCATPIARVLPNRTEARERIAGLSPEVAEAIATARPGVLAVVVADGAVTLHEVTRVRRR